MSQHSGIIKSGDEERVYGCDFVKMSECFKIIRATFREKRQSCAKINFLKSLMEMENSKQKHFSSYLPISLLKCAIKNSFTKFTFALIYSFRFIFKIEQSRPTETHPFHINAS